MIRVLTPRASLISRTTPIAAVIGLLAVVLMGVIVPSDAAAPAAPYFGPAVLVDQPPAYTAATPSLAVGHNGVLYLAFSGWGGATTQSDIFFTKSSDGRTWTVPVRVNNDAGNAFQGDPSLALDSADNIYIAWTDSRNAGNLDVYFSKSADGGLSFTANVRVNDVTTNAQTEPAVAVDPLNPNLVHVAWTDTRSAITGPDIFYANSTDGGLSFNPSLRINTDAGASEQGTPAIAVAPNRDVYVAWGDPRNAARGRDIYFSKSADRGATWSPNIYLNDDSAAAAQQDPAIGVDIAGTIYVAWSDFRNANTGPDIYATRSINAGSSFAANVKVNDDAGVAWQWLPRLATNAGKVQVAWADSRTSGSTSWDIYTSSSVDGLTWTANMKVNDDSLNVFQWSPSIAIDRLGDVFAAWLDNRGASGQDVYASFFDVVSPTANAGASTTVNQGATVAFNGSGSSDNLGIAGYAWDFGDGSSGAGSTGSHGYMTPGVFTATLTVWDYSGNVATGGRTITVLDTEAPMPRGGGDRSVDEGQPLFFDASGSTDNVGVASYDWNFGDGASASTATASHVYAQPGSYTATLTVTDAEGNSATSTFAVTVRTVSPKPSELLGMIQDLQGIVAGQAMMIQLLEVVLAVLAIALALLGWMVIGMRRRQRRPPPMPATAYPPAQPPAQPPREQDPLDMPLPPRGP